VERLERRLDSLSESRTMCDLSFLRFSDCGCSPPLGNS
jgi:hypothetical protein